MFQMQAHLLQMTKGLISHSHLIIVSVIKESSQSLKMIQ